MNRNSAVNEKELPKGTFRNSFIIKNAKSTEKMKYVPIGAFPLHPDGAHEITREKLEEMIANQANDLMIDLGHDSMWNPGARAYGWIPRESLEVREDGLYGNSPEWTPDAAEMVEQRHYRFLSPAYQLQSQDKKNGEDRGARLWPIALTNTPYFDSEIDALKNSATKTEETPEMKYPAELKKKLGLAEDATDEQVDEKLDALLASGETEDDDKDEKKTDPEKSEDDELVANSAILKKLEAIEARLNKSDADGKKVAAEALVNSAVSEGKILPADKTIWLNAATADFDGTKKLLDARKKNSALPGKVITATEPAGDEKPKKNSHQALTEYLKNEGRMPIAYRQAHSTN